MSGVSRWRDSGHGGTLKLVADFGDEQLKLA